MTILDMCKTIVRSGIAKEGVSAEDIYNYSSNGELIWVFILYEMALEKLNEEIPVWLNGFNIPH